MEITVKNKNENGLLGRIELVGMLSFSGATPSYPQIKQAFAAHFKVKEDIVAVKQVLTDFGATTANFSIYIYESVEQLNKIEPKLKEKKAKTLGSSAPAAGKKE